MFKFNGYDNRVAGLDSPSQNRKNPPLRFIVLLFRVSACLDSTGHVVIDEFVSVSHHQLETVPRKQIASVKPKGSLRLSMGRDMREF